MSSLALLRPMHRHEDYLPSPEGYGSVPPWTWHGRRLEDNEDVYRFIGLRDPHKLMLSAPPREAQKSKQTSSTKRLFHWGLAIIAVGFVAVAILTYWARSAHRQHLASAPYAVERAIYDWLGYHRILPVRL